MLATNMMCISIRYVQTMFTDSSNEILKGSKSEL